MSQTEEKIVEQTVPVEENPPKIDPAQEITAPAEEPNQVAPNIEQPPKNGNDDSIQQEEATKPEPEGKI